MSLIDPRDRTEISVRNATIAGLAFLIAMAIGYAGFGKYREWRCERAGGTWVAKGKICQQ